MWRQARRDIITQIKIKCDARDCEKTAINFGPDDFAKFAVPMPSPWDEEGEFDETVAL